jgi:hypothetical protein
MPQSAAPKKETARITLPPEGSKAGLPKATIKMQQTQPLVNKPAPMSVSSSGFSPAVVASSPAAEPAEDGAVKLLSILALVASLASLGLVYLAFSASAGA